VPIVPPPLFASVTPVFPPVLPNTTPVAVPLGPLVGPAFVSEIHSGG
jgi:hypothetical protein